MLKTHGCTRNPTQDLQSKGSAVTTMPQCPQPCFQTMKNQHEATASHHASGGAIVYTEAKTAQAKADSFPLWTSSIKMSYPRRLEDTGEQAVVVIVAFTATVHLHILLMRATP